MVETDFTPKKEYRIEIIVEIFSKDQNCNFHNKFVMSNYYDPFNRVFCLLKNNILTHDKHACWFYGT